MGRLFIPLNYLYVLCSVILYQNSWWITILMVHMIMERPPERHCSVIFNFKFVLSNKPQYENITMLPCQYTIKIC